MSPTASERIAPFLKGIVAIALVIVLCVLCFKLMAALMPLYDLGVS